MITRFAQISPEAATRKFFDAVSKVILVAVNVASGNVSRSLVFVFKVASG